MKFDNIRRQIGNDYSGLKWLWENFCNFYRYEVNLDKADENNKRRTRCAQAGDQGH